MPILGKTTSHIVENETSLWSSLPDQEIVGHNSVRP